MRPRSIPSVRCMRCMSSMNAGGASYLRSGQGGYFCRSPKTCTWQSQLPAGAHRDGVRVSRWNCGNVLPSAIGGSGGGKPSRDNLLVGNVAVKDADVARKLIHAGDELAGNFRVVIGEVTADQFGDQFGLERREQLPADLRGKRHVLFERRVCLAD